MQRSGTEATRTQIQPSKPKREITKIINGQHTKRTYGQPSEQLFPRNWPLSNPNRTNILWTHVRLNVNETLTPKTGNREPQQYYHLGTVRNELLGGGLKLIFRAQHHPQFLKWYKTFSWLFGSHDNPLTRQ